jgi:hypothetical protein
LGAIAADTQRLIGTVFALERLASVDRRLAVYASFCSRCGEVGWKVPRYGSLPRYRIFLSTFFPCAHYSVFVRLS